MTARRRRMGRKAAYGALAALSVANVFPIYWIAVTSLKIRAEQATMPTVWFPTTFTFSNFLDTFVARGFGGYLFNSLLAALASTALCMTLGSLAGYSLARFRFPGRVRQGVGFWILSTRMFPPIVSVVPLFFLARQLSLVDSRGAIIAAYTLFNLPLVVWMTRGVFREVPQDLEEAAMVDGLTRLSAFARVTLPLAAPGLAATAILCMILSFNEFLFALTLGTLKAVTLPVGIASCVTQYKVMWGEMSAAGLVAVVPIVAFVLVAQKHLVRGLTMGAVKG